MLGASCGNLFQIFCVRVAFLLLFGDCDGHVPGVFNHMPKRLQSGLEAGYANCGRSHIHAAARLAEVEGHTNDADLTGSDARRGDVCHGFSRNKIADFQILQPVNLKYSAPDPSPALVKAHGFRMSTTKFYGYNRCSILGNGIVSRTCSSPQIHATARSMPMPKPAWGTLPYFRRSRYHLNASSGSPCS